MINLAIIIAAILTKIVQLLLELTLREKLGPILAQLGIKPVV